MVDIKMSPGGAVPDPFFWAPFVPSQPAHLSTYLPGVPLILLSAHIPYYAGCEQFHLPLCRAKLTRRMLPLLARTTRHLESKQLAFLNNFTSYTCQSNFITPAKHAPILVTHQKAFLVLNKQLML